MWGRSPPRPALRQSSVRLPVWLRFRGGKGVATACGVFSVLTPFAIGPTLAVFLGAVWISRYISVGSIVASVALPPIAYATGSPAPVLGAAVAASTLILIRPEPTSPASPARHRATHRPPADVAGTLTCGRSRFWEPAAGAPRLPSISAASATMSGCGPATSRSRPTFRLAARTPSIYLTSRFPKRSSSRHRFPRR